MSGNPSAPPVEATAEPVALVLAAGASRRMGTPKMLLPWPSSGPAGERAETTVLGSTLAALLAGGARRAVVVIAADGPLVEWRPPAGVEVAVNPDPERGMMSSVLAGLELLATRHPALAPAPLLVTPGDLPALRAATVALLLGEFARQGGVVVPRHGTRRGHPLLLGGEWQRRIPQIAAQGGTLRQVLDLAGDQLHEVAVDDPGAIEDVDTPDAYAALRQR